MLGCLMVLVVLSFLRMENRPTPPVRRSAHAFTPLAFEFEWQKIMLLSWGLVPLLIGYAISIAGRPILYDRYLIGSLPALMLLAARGLRVVCFNRLILAGALVILLACILPTLHAVTVKTREDHRAAVATFAGRFQDSDEVLLFGMYPAFAYYFRAPVSHKTILAVSTAIINTAIIDPWTGDKLISEDPTTANLDWRDGRRVWLFIRQKGPHEIALMQRVEALYSVGQEFHFDGASLYLYIRKLGT